MLQLTFLFLFLWLTILCPSFISSAAARRCTRGCHVEGNPSEYAMHASYQQSLAQKTTLISRRSRRLPIDTSRKSPALYHGVDKPAETPTESEIAAENRRALRREWWSSSDPAFQADYFKARPHPPKNNR
ncbi:hypothetical protein GOP47_0007530 [Adiantum capillus-veneris]|nr:hypothetical protein GOP47_0007530 [Adiantum capillus-veneris]